MRCDVVAVGTELLLGQIVDTNSSWIGEQLASSGIDSLLQVKVGDNLGRITATLRHVLAEADAAPQPLDSLALLLEDRRDERRDRGRRRRVGAPAELIDLSAQILELALVLVERLEQRTVDL